MAALSTAGQTTEDVGDASNDNVASDQILDLLRESVRNLGSGLVLVSRDLGVVAHYCERVAVMRSGRIVEEAPVRSFFAAPRELYRDPANVFVAGFIGSPAMNLISLPVLNDSVALGGWEIRAPRGISGPDVVVGIRPEHLEVSGIGIEIEVDVVEELGADAYVYGRIVDGATPVIARTDGLDPPQRGGRVRLQPVGGHIHFFGADGLPIR